MVLSTHKQTSTLELFIFILSMSFAPQYLPIDIRPGIYLFWIFIIFFRGVLFKKIKITNYAKVTLLFLLLISIYSILVVLFSLSGDNYVYMRYIRALVALIIIILYVNTSNIDTSRLVRALTIVLTLHSIIIITEIIFPGLKDIMQPFSGESRRFYPYRANGLVNSYDLAGMYTILGLIISAIGYIKSRKKIFLFISIISIVATLFTSRLNMVVLVLILGFLFKKSKGTGVLVYRALIFLLFIIIGIVGIGLLSMTTDIFPILREIVFSNSWSNKLYTMVRNTYSDDDFLSILLYHFDIGIDSTTSLLLGKGTEGYTDPGYSKILNSIGILGMISIIAYYFYQLFYINKLRCKGVFDKDYQVFITIVFILLVMLFGNLKILYFFSTSLFELLSLFMILYELSYLSNIKRSKWSN